MSRQTPRKILFPIVLLAAGGGLVYWSWQPRGREEALALGILLVGVAVPLLLYAVSRARW